MVRELERSIESNPLRELRGGLDAIVLLGGNVRSTKLSLARTRVTTSYVEGTEKSIGGHARVIAAREIYRGSISNTFIVSTKDAKVYGDELARHGIPPERIILEERSTSTLEDAQNSAGIIRDLGFSSVGVLTSYWHLDRAMLMFCTQDFDSQVRLLPLSADHIVAAISPRHKRVVREMMRAPTIAERIRHEENGIEAFRRGDYVSRPFEWNIWTSPQNPR